MRAKNWCNRGGRGDRGESGNRCDTKARRHKRHADVGDIRRKRDKKEKGLKGPLAIATPGAMSVVRSLSSHEMEVERAMSHPVT